MGDPKKTRGQPKGDGTDWRRSELNLLGNSYSNVQSGVTTERLKNCARGGERKQSLGGKKRWREEMEP